MFRDSSVYWPMSIELMRYRTDRNTDPAGEFTDAAGFITQFPQTSAGLLLCNKAIIHGRFSPVDFDVT